MRVYFTLIIALTFFISSAVLAETRFFSVLPNVPVASGLTPAPDQASVFDKVEGRIVEAVALLDSSVSQDSVTQYYQKTLPAFGWSLDAEGQFARGTERLRLSYETRHELVYLTITLSP